MASCSGGKVATGFSVVWTLRTGAKPMEWLDPIPGDWVLNAATTTDSLVFDPINQSSGFS